MSDGEHLDNVCMSGTYVVGAFFVGLAICSVLFTQVFILSHH